MKVITAEINDDLFRKLLMFVDKTGITNINAAIDMITSKALENYLEDGICDKSV